MQRLFHNDGLKPLLEQVLNQVLQAQVTEQIGAAPHQRTQERQGYRNGSRERLLTTRVGSLTLQVPRLRQGTFATDLFDRYQRSEQALLLCMVEMVIAGVSTRKVSAVVEELCGEEVSKSTVSALCQRRDPQVNAWRERDLSQTRYPFVLVDALVIRVRKDGRVRQQSLLLATGINEEGYRQILKRLRTTNSQERLNEEIRRRERVIRIFPNPASAERLLGALLMEFDEAFSTGHRYFDMTDYWVWKQQQSSALVEQKAA